MSEKSIVKSMSGSRETSSEAIVIIQEKGWWLSLGITGTLWYFYSIQFSCPLARGTVSCATRQSWRRAHHLALQGEKAKPGADCRFVTELECRHFAKDLRSIHHKATCVSNLCTQPWNLKEV